MIHTTRNLNVSGDEIELDLRKILKVMRKWSRLIVVITLMTTVGSALISYYVMTPVYQAKALLMVTVASDKLQTTTNQVNKTDPKTGTTAPMPVLTMNTYLGQLKSEALIKRVQTQLDLTNSSIGSISSKISASIVENSNLIEVKVSDTDPQMALAIANAVSEQYLELMREFMFSSVVVISPANLPTSPIKPNKQLNTIVAFILGFIISVLLAFLLEYLDNTLKTADDVNRELGLTVLGLIPVFSEHNTWQNGLGGAHGQ